MLAIQPPEVLSLPKNELLRQVMTVRLDGGDVSRTYGRGLLQAPNKCPNATGTGTEAKTKIKIAQEWAPVVEASFRSRSQTSQSRSDRSTGYSGGSSSYGGGGSGYGGGGSGHSGGGSGGAGGGSGHGGRR